MSAHLAASSLFAMGGLIRPCWPALVSLFLCIVPWSSCAAADLLVIASGSTSDNTIENSRNLHIAAEYYGVTIDVVHIRTKSDIQRALERMTDRRVFGVAIPADVLPEFNESRVFAAVRRAAAAIPLFVNGVNARTNALTLQSWSRGAIRQCSPPTQVQSESLLLGSTKSVLHQLAGLTIPAANSPACVFVVGGDLPSETLAAYGTVESATFVRMKTGPQELFLAADSGRRDLPNARSATELLRNAEFFRNFSQLLPSMVFVRYAAGESGWHAPAHYANLTVDDVWLRQPYGHLDFQSLLGEMGKHNFHTTLAFIPWNFDRSEPKAIAIIGKHPDRYSICIHGDNHDHEEFFLPDGDGRFKALPDAEQAARVKQAVARMERFRILTGIPYDRFMIFPHEMFPAVTLRFMKSYNYVGMANATLTPLEGQQPDDARFFLNATTTSFENFPSTRRYSAERLNAPENLIAVAAFLEHPLLFYAHHAYFANGAKAFNSTAEFINRIDPAVNWTGLGNIAQRLYKIRRRPDNDFDLWTMTADLRLRNASIREETYHVIKDENFADPIRQVSVNGQPITYNRRGNTLTLVLKVPAGQERHVQIEYGGGLNVSAIDVSKPSWRINSLRRISDFRDLVLSKSILGDKLVAFYYRCRNASGWTLYRMVFVCLLVGGGLLLAIVWRRWYFRRKGATAQTTLPLC